MTKRKATSADKCAGRALLDRRGLLAGALSAGVAAGLGQIVPAAARRGKRAATLLAGEGRVDTTPPLGIELAGFHRPAGKERRIKGIRQPTAARALVLTTGRGHPAAIISLDICGASAEFTRRVQRKVARRTGIPAANVRVCATHTHSMPAFCYLRQWGAVPDQYMAEVEEKCVAAVEQAKADLAPASLRVGRSRAAGANHNRTRSTFKTDDLFGKDSTHADRWLDTTVHVMLIERAGGRPTLLWYHFSAHPVCYADELAGPDWPGLVERLVQDSHRLRPAFLQGHAGDVNPGRGKPWRGDAQKTAAAVHDAIRHAVDQAETVTVERIESRATEFHVPLDLERMKNWLAQYRQDPSRCTRGHWVDAGFARDWFQANANRKFERSYLPVQLSAVVLGPVGLVFHPAELYSFYGLVVRRDSPLAHTIVVGYADDLIGYLPDPQAYRSGEYAAMVVPKILDYPPFTPEAAGKLATGLLKLLRQPAHGHSAIQESYVTVFANQST